VIDEPSFIWKVSVKMNPFIWFQGRFDNIFNDWERGENLLSYIK